ncbi:MAG: hypothetical protein ACI4DU_03515 [Lachnospiraceae bacterium]
MKKISLMIMVGIMGMALMGCGGQESSTGGTQGSEQSADQYIDELENDIQTMIEEEEAQHEAEFEAQYPEGILPAGHYRAVDNTPDGFIAYFDAGYNVEYEEGIIIETYDIVNQPNWFTIPSYYVNPPENSYVYDPETGLYHFEIYCRYQGEYYLVRIVEGYYSAEDDTFTITYCGNNVGNESVEIVGTEEGYEKVLVREIVE